MPAHFADIDGVSRWLCFGTQTGAAPFTYDDLSESHLTSLIEGKIDGDGTFSKSGYGDVAVIHDSGLERRNLPLFSR